MGTKVVTKSRLGLGLALVTGLEGLGMASERLGVRPECMVMTVSPS